jgi:hypothetical protein
MYVEAETVEPVVVRAADGRVRHCLEHVRYARDVSEVQLEVDYYRVSVVQAVLAA